MSSNRRHLNITLDPHAKLAMQHAAQWEQSDTEQVTIRFPLDKLTPSPANPRRLTLDHAGLTRESVLAVARKASEPVEQWMDRLEQHVEQVAAERGAKAGATWAKLRDLAYQLAENQLLQPIVASMDGTIIAGERRWLASMLAGLTHNRVLQRELDDLTRLIAQFVENTQRDNLNLREEVFGLRAVVAQVTGQPCGPDNKGITIRLCQQLMGMGRTQAWEYSVLCRLPEGHEVLERIRAGAYTRKEDAARDAKESLGDFRRTNAADAALPDAAIQGGEGAQATQGKPAAPVRARGPAGPAVKMRLPGTEGGRRILQAVAGIPDLPADVVEQIGRVTDAWTAAPEKARRKMLADVLNTVIEGMDAIDQDDGSQDADSGSR